MKRFLAFLCVLAMALSLVDPAVFAASYDLQAAIDAGAEEIIVLEADASNVTVNRDIIIDLNGHDIDDVTVLAGTLYCMDSATADYTVADGVYGHVTNVAGAVKAAEGYLQVGDSFHAVDLDIYAMTLRAADVGVYYKSNFAADEIVAAQVESFGVALSVVTAPDASNLETYCGYSEFSGFEAGEGANAVGTSTLLKNIMKAANGDEKNGKNAAMPVYGRAYIKTSDGYFFGETVKRSLQEQVEAIDGVWAGLSEAQKTPVLSMLESYTSVMENWNIPHIQGIQVPGAEGEIELPIEVTTENGVVTEAVTVEHSGVSVTVPAGVKLAEGANKLTLTVTPVEAEDTGLTLKEDRVLIPMDVHVEGVAADNAQPLTIYLGKIMPENLNMGNYTVYHVENGKANEMVLIPVDAEFTAHNQYKYSLDGELTLYMASFSVVAAEVDKTNAWKGDVDRDWYTEDAKEYEIRNADQLAGFNKLVSEGTDFNGKIVKLLSDINFEGATWYPIGYWAKGEGKNKANEEWYTYGGAFSGTFDGNGNTISNISQNTWAMDGNYSDGYWDEAMGLFGYVVNGTVKNLTVDNFSSDGEFTPTGVITAYACNSTFENIAITNCNPRVYNTGNGGIVGIGGNSNDPDTYELTFNNITIDNSNIISALWGSWDVACGGLVGMFRGAGHVYMTNCHVAAQIDVNNDVCGNYQYYWYRYSGMLVGTNQNMITDEDGYTVPETEKFHAENCTVHFGTWNDYYYCELVANSLASYTHDHQMSRLVEIKAINGTTITYLDGTTGTVPASGRANYVIVNGEEGTDNANCYHFVDGEVWNHEDAGTETVNGVAGVLKEDKQHIYLPFKQLFTGYGWGVKHIPIYDDGSQNVFEGVTILPRETADSVVKFDSLVADGAEYAAGTTLTIGDLFKATAQTDVAIDVDNVQVTVSPADDTSTVSGTYVANAKDWTKGYLVLVGSGAAKITITDYNFCKETVLDVSVEAPKADTTTGAYVKVTEEPADWSGDYLIVYEAGNVAFNGGLTTLDAVSNTISVTISDGKIAADEIKNAAKFTIAKSGLAYTIQSASGYYVGQTSNANGLASNKITTYNNTISLNSDDTEIVSGGAYLRYNATSGQTRFRYYKSSTYTGQKAITLYKYVAGSTGSNCDHLNATITVETIDCVTPGTIQIQCDTCEFNNSVKVAAWGHNYGESVVTKEATCTEAGEETATCSICQKVESNKISATGHNYENRVCHCGEKEIINVNIPENGRYELVTEINDIKDGGKFVIVAEVDGVHYAMGADATGGKIQPQSVTVNDGIIEDAGVAAWIIKPYGNGELVLENEDGAYLKQNEADLSTSKSSPFGWTVQVAENSENCFNIVSVEENARSITYRAGDYNCFKAYTNTAGTYYRNLKLYKFVEVEAEEVTKTITFDNTSKRTTFTTTKQVWEENGITVTNNKGSGSNIADYSNPARFYASSELIVACSKMTKIVFVCDSSSYATALKNSIDTVEGATVTVSSDKVTVTFTNAVDSFTIAKLFGQVRMDSITVTYTTN